jgi:L-asparaginase II
VFSRLGDLDDSLPTAIDGCSAPTFGVALKSLAVAFARLANCASDRQADTLLDNDLAKAAKRAVKAMIRYPEMIGGTKGRFDTDLLRASRGKLICKVGAEAVYAVGVLPCERFPRGAGVAFKIEDGSYRGLGPAVIETLAQIGVLDETETAQLAAYHRPVVDNRRGLPVGSVRATFNLSLNN